jgi:hypothetical protein
MKDFLGLYVLVLFILNIYYFNFDEQNLFITVLVKNIHIYITNNKNFKFNPGNKGKYASR